MKKFIIDILEMYGFIILFEIVLILLKLCGVISWDLILVSNFPLALMFVSIAIVNKAVLGEVRIMREEKIIWHEVTTRPPTEEEIEYFKEIYAEDPEYIFDCEMPDDGQDVLTASYYGVDIDTCIIDDYGYGFESGGSWDDILAWAELPKYKVGEDNDE